jgi:DNA-directed RNA polymerase
MNRFGLLPAANDAMSPRRTRKLGESQYLVLHVNPIPSPGFAELRVIKRSKYSDRENSAR